MVDQNAALGLIDELRVAVPEEVRAAKRINSEGERIIEKAQEEAERIVARAQEQAAFLIDERGLTQAAEAESRRMIAEAHEDGERIRGGADEYAVSVLEGLEGDVTKTLQSIQKGIAMLDDRRATLMAAPAEDGEAGRLQGRRLGRRGGGRRRARPVVTPAPMSAPADDDPFLWNVAGLLSDTVGADRHYDVADARVELPDELTLAEPIDGRVRLTHTNRGILARAQPPHGARDGVRPLPPADHRAPGPGDRGRVPALARHRDGQARGRRRRARCSSGSTTTTSSTLSPPCATRSRWPSRSPRSTARTARACARPAACRSTRATHDHPTDDIDPRLEALRGFRPEGKD